MEGLLSTGPTPSSSSLLIEMGLPLHIFPAYMWWELEQLFIKRHTIKIWNELKGPIQTRLEALLGFLGKTKIKAYKKLTATGATVGLLTISIMLKKKLILKKFIHRGCGLTSVGGGGHPKEFSIPTAFLCLTGLAEGGGGSTTINMTLIFSFCCLDQISILWARPSGTRPGLYKIQMWLCCSSKIHHMLAK